MVIVVSLSPTDVPGQRSQRTAHARSGWALEARRSGSEPWQSWLGEIRVPVHLWQGDEDRLNRPVMGEYLADAIPDCRPTVVQGAGHLWGIDHMNEVFDVLFAT